MEVITAFPTNKKQLKALKAVMKALGINFTEQGKIVKLPPHLIESVKISIAEADKGIGLRPYLGIQDMLNN